MPQRGNFLSAGKPTWKLACFIQSRIYRDAYKREQFAKYEVERKALRYIIRSNAFSGRQKLEAQLQLTQLPVSSQPTKVKGRCVVGGKGRGILRDFKMARFPFRMAALAGQLPGVRKASW